MSDSGMKLARRQMALNPDLAPMSAMSVKRLRPKRRESFTGRCACGHGRDAHLFDGHAFVMCWSNPDCDCEAWRP